jgi:hypothetical protein
MLPDAQDHEGRKNGVGNKTQPGGSEKLVGKFSLYLQLNELGFTLRARLTGFRH